MKKVILIITFVLIIVQTGAAQSTITIESGGSHIVLTIWEAGENPQATVLLVPGWGGGPADVLGIGKALSSEGISSVILTPRGWHNSEGTYSFAHAFEDIKAALNWIRNSKRADIKSTEVILGGHSWGGGMCLAYAAQDTMVKRIFSVAGTDHGILIRKYLSDEKYAARIDKLLASTAVPDGPIRFDVKKSLNELAEGQEIYGIMENAGKLADRSILIFGGWEDTNTTIDEYLLPDYRALKTAGAEDVIFKTYHDNHAFRQVRKELYSDLISWIKK